MLLAVVILIWGVLIYKVISALGGEDSESIITSAPSTKKTIAKPQAPKPLILDYRDPFLGKTSFKKSRKNTKTNKTKTPPKSTPPAISYLGQMVDENSKQVVFFVKYNGITQAIGSKQKIQDVEILSGNAKQIRIRYQKKMYTIKRN